ncbi:DNA polymerase epsilon subunit 1 [Nematocida major]|uniref:DNA polymerase epsilon subunit 1 n=1 Tax=Nematocida major TaxID=1912982 RepID=UPI00200824F3|nr:DNA polymerase epsilon subunit 1 [Nematocida major]KAH9386608.1 DNA polymerase epsilon subunit 1 [Nematocida major]
MESALSANVLADYFEYNVYNGMSPREGWLLNYHMENKTCAESGRVMTHGIMYFVDSENKNFRIEVPFSSRLLVEVGETSLTSVEEYLVGKYPNSIKSVDVVKRVDLQKDNHLATDGCEYLEVSIYSEQDAALIRKELEEISRRNKAQKKEKAATLLFVKEKRQCVEADPQEAIVGVHEYDISTVVQMSVALGINAGRWYRIECSGEYKITEMEKVIPPDLRIFSFDIETTKDPLKFPSADKDRIMMISIMSTVEGWLLINREIVSEDIQPFEFRPTEDIGGDFDIFNEKNEQDMLNKFMELLHTYKPHIITTYNGDFFDWPFVEARLAHHGINLNVSLGFKNNGKDEYVCDYILHMDCYKWVKRDSYLPAGSQGLKSVTKAKLGYHPDEIDPENMVLFAETKPKLMASYSVSDAIATHFLYLKYVHPFIFSLASLIPLPPDDVLRKGSGTLCETLLVKEARGCSVLIPPKKKAQLLHNYNGRMAESLSYVGGHVECLKSGIYRSDFEYEFSFDRKGIENMVRNVETIVDLELKGRPCKNKQEVVQNIVEKLEGLKELEKAKLKPHIYHLDVGAMYPNIILTNRLQPSAITNEKRCGQCVYLDQRSICQRKLQWKARAEVYPVDEKTVAVLSKRASERYYRERAAAQAEGKPKEKGKREQFITYEHYLREGLIEYARKNSKKTREVIIEEKQSITCQRENPFYVNAVRKFRDRRNEYKKLAKAAKAQAKAAESEPHHRSGESPAEWAKKAGVYDSLQIAHKCVLNSFYGYVMKKGARWHSMEMAAVVCQTGSSIIQKTKKVIDAFGITLELDTDGIWALLPEMFPLNYTLQTESGEVGFSYICSLLNHMLLEAFSNDQYQEKDSTGKYLVRSENSIQFEIDGPYRAMFLPGSTKEGESIKKRYIVINNKEKISELKGFEFKRRGELMFIKAFQEEMFNMMLAGKTLEECYSALAGCADYWIDIIETKAEALAQDEIFTYFGETRNMAKSAEEYSVAKSTCLTAAERLTELLGQNVVAKGMSCAFIITKYPENEPVTSRSVPQSVFYASKELKDKYLRKWLCLRTVPEDIREIVDWGYYLERLSNIIARIIIVPAVLQGISNPVKRIQPPQWTVSRRKIIEFLTKTTAEEKEAASPQIQAHAQPDQAKKESAPAPRTPAAQKLLEYLQVKKKEAAAEKADAQKEGKAQRAKRESESAVYVSRISESAFTAVYLCDGKFVEQEKKIKKIFYLQTSAELLEAILRTNQTAAASMKTERVFKHAVGVSGEREYVRIEIDPVEFKSKFHKYTGLFESPEVKSIHELDIPQEIRVLEAARFRKVPVYVVAACTAEGKSTYSLFCSSEYAGAEVPEKFGRDTEGVQIFENDAYASLLSELEIKPAGAVFFTKSLPGGPLKTKHLHIPLDVPSVKTIQGKEVAKGLLLDTLCRASKAAQSLVDIAEYSNTPILPGDLAQGSLVLDYLHYKERSAKNIIGWNDSQSAARAHYTLGTDDENPFKKEFYKEGVYEGISVGVSLSGTVLLSIIEADTLTKEERSSFKQGVEMEALQALAKSVVYGCIKKQKGALELANRFPFWIRSSAKSTTITEAVSARVGLLQIKFVSGVVAAINRAGSDVVLADCEDLIVYTGQATQQMAQVQMDSVVSVVGALAYGSLLRIHFSQWYRRILIIDQANYHKKYLSGKVQYEFMHPIPAGVIDSLLSNDDLSALECIKDAYMKESQSGVLLARLLIKIHGLKYREPHFSRKASAIVHLSPFSEELSREFGEFVTLSMECACSATTAMHSSLVKPLSFAETEHIFACLIQNSQKIAHKCRKCFAPFSRAVMEARLIQEMYRVAKRVIKMERKCSRCKKPCSGMIEKRCACGGQFERNVKKDFQGAVSCITSLCLIVPTASVIIYAKEMVNHLLVCNE